MSFYPPGWDYDRVLNVSSMDEFSSITDEQRYTLLEGLKEVGLYDGVMEAWRRVREGKDAAGEAAKTEERLYGSEPMPDQMSLNNSYLSDEGWSEWGFVIYRACCYDPADGARWAQFRARFDRILDNQMTEFHFYHPQLNRVIKLRRNIWIEDPALDNATPEDISRRYNQLWPNLSDGYGLAVCLMVTDDSVESVLNSPFPWSAPQAQRETLPFVIAVNRMAHELPHTPSPEDEDVADEGEHLPSFRVAVESLLEGLYGTIDMGDLLDMTSNMRHEKDIWLSRPLRYEGVRHYEDLSQPEGVFGFYSHNAQESSNAEES